MSPAALPRGKKHRCAKCSAAFYDMERELTACPKCGTAYEEGAAMPSEGRRPRKSRNWTTPAPAVVEKAPEAEAEEEETEDGVPILDDVNGVEADTDDAEEIVEEPEPDDTKPN
jgi:predicted  nucleic acid-binding Zn-ribbon protein